MPCLASHLSHSLTLRWQDLPQLVPLEAFPMQSRLSCCCRVAVRATPRQSPGAMHMCHLRYRAPDLFGSLILRDCPLIIRPFSVREYSAADKSYSRVARDSFVLIGLGTLGIEQGSRISEIILPLTSNIAENHRPLAIPWSSLVVRHDDRVEICNLNHRLAAFS